VRGLRSWPRFCFSRPCEGDLLILRLAALVFSAWVLLSGCAGPTYSYSKPGSSEMDWKQDSYACTQAPRTSGGGTGLVGAATDAKRLYKTCMEARGWTAEAPR